MEKELLTEKAKLIHQIVNNFKFDENWTTADLQRTIAEHISETPAVYFDWSNMTTEKANNNKPKSVTVVFTDGQLMASKVEIII